LHITKGIQNLFYLSFIGEANETFYKY